jgi:hypothetical protein
MMKTIRRSSEAKQRLQEMHDDEDIIKCIILIHIKISNDETNILSVYEVSARNSRQFRLSANLRYKNWVFGKTLAKTSVKVTTKLKVKTVSHCIVERIWLTGDTRTTKKSTEG